MTRLPSASKLQLAATCVGAHVLPGVSTAWASGEAGRERHAELARHVAGEAIKAPSSWLAALLEYGDDLAPLRGCRDEVAYAWDLESGEARELGQRLERAYESVCATEYYGTADYVRVSDGHVVVVDLKTGMSEVPHPTRNAQLRFLALAACRAHGLEAARVGILHAPEGRAPWWQWADLDAFELEVVAEDLRALHRRLEAGAKAVEAGEAPRLTLGEHCNWCPARYSCPARTAMARAMGQAPDDFAAALKASLEDDATAGDVLARWRAAKKIVEEVGAALHARAAERPIFVEAGQVWGPRESTREVIDGEAAWPVLVGLLGVEGARQAMTLATSRAGVERGVKHAKAEGVMSGTIKAGVAQALDALRAAGAVAQKSRTEYEVYPATPGIGLGVGDAGHGAD